MSTTEKGFLYPIGPIGGRNKDNPDGNRNAKEKFKKLVET
jgi:hypothetical protein